MNFFENSIFLDHSNHYQNLNLSQAVTDDYDHFYRASQVSLYESNEMNGPFSHADFPLILPDR